jgi:hypothetical protein
MTMQRVFFLAAAVSLIAVTIALAPDKQGHAASTMSLQLLMVQEDSFMNYDFTNTGISSIGVDWATSILFWNNAEVDKVKNTFYNPYNYSGSDMYSWIDDGTGHWDPQYDQQGSNFDSDAGVKTNAYCPAFGSSNHFRLYADADDRLHNINWGFYVVATIHYDHNECNIVGKWYGKSEDAELEFANTAVGKLGSSAVIYSWSQLNWQNAESYREEGDHYWQNNGLATVVCIP